MDRPFPRMSRIPRQKRLYAQKDRKLTDKHLQRIKNEHLMRIKIEDSNLREKIDSINSEVNHYIRYLESRYDEMIDRIRRG